MNNQINYMVTKRSPKNKVARRPSKIQKNFGVRMRGTGEGGRSWERPTSNNGRIKTKKKKIVEVVENYNLYSLWNSIFIIV